MTAHLSACSSLIVLPQASVRHLLRIRPDMSENKITTGTRTHAHTAEIQARGCVHTHTHLGATHTHTEPWTVVKPAAQLVYSPDKAVQSHSHTMDSLTSKLNNNH